LTINQTRYGDSDGRDVVCGLTQVADQLGHLTHQIVPLQACLVAFSYDSFVAHRRRPEFGLGKLDTNET
jgi:hypothetical protein